MQITVSPSALHGSVTAPASKSAMQRACAAALLKGGRTVLHNPGASNDDTAALNIIQQLGAVVRFEDGTVVIQSNGVKPIGNEIHCGESGLSIRMFTSIAALSEVPVAVTGSGSLTKRPQPFFAEALPKLGVHYESNNGYLPMKVKGPLQPRDIDVDGSLSSQFLTGLLMAYSAAGASGVTVTVRDLNSKPYVDLTLQVMKDFGLAVPVNKEYERFLFDNDFSSGVLKVQKPEPEALHYTVEGDWSGGAFLLVAGAVAGEVTVKGLNTDSTQADKAILQALIQTGAWMSADAEQIIVRKSRLKAFRFDATDCPDLFPPLVALAAYGNGTSVIEGVRRLAHKESNRAVTLQEEFGKMGVKIELQDDLMRIQGGGRLQGAAVRSHHDHRIAMACAVAALGADGSTVVDEAEAINKSYPQFWEHLQTLQTLAGHNS